MKKQRLVVVGNGMAGARLVEEVIARGGRDLFDVVVFGDEPYGNYNRILLSSVLAGSHQPEDIVLNPLSWYAENGVALHAGAQVRNIDRTSRRVYAAGGIVEEYDKLVLATGSSPFVPPLGGVGKEGVFVFRTLDDCEAIASYAPRARRAAVIGGGLLGLEAARGLLNRGLEVEVVHLMDHLMEVQLDRPAGGMLKAVLERMGLRFHLEKITTRVLGNGHVAGLAFQDGSSFGCDMVVISAGIRPNVELARACGINVERGIVVHNDLSTRNDPNVYALGECAQHRGQIYGLVAPAWEQAAVLADVLTGANPRASYHGSKLSTKLKVMGVELAVIGEKEPTRADDEVVSYVEPSRGVYKKLVVRDGKLLGAIVLGDGAMTPRLLQAFDAAEELPESRAEVLFPLAWGAKPATVAELPDSALICNCNGVSKGRLVAAMRDGCRSVEALRDATRAGTGCGSCTLELQAILELDPGRYPVGV